MEKKNLKKTGISYFAASLLLLAITFVNVRIAMAGDVSFKSMFASSYSGEDGEGGGESGEGDEGGESGEGGEGGEDSGEGGESGEGDTPEERCHNRGGAYNTYLKCVDGGVVKDIRCEIEGKISAFGITAEGSYKKGEKYNVSWSRWACESGTGNCCIVSQQGIKINQ